MGSEVIALYIQSSIILLTGLTAFLTFFIKNKQEMRNAARIIYLEIKNSEQYINHLRTTGIATEETIVLPNNSWVNYSHLFIKKLDFEDYFLIDNYYLSCSKLQDMLDEARSYHDNAIMEKGLDLQRKLISLVNINSENPEEEYKIAKDKLLPVVHEETYWFVANFPRERIGKYIATIRPLMGTTCFDKIKKISGIK